MIVADFRTKRYKCKSTWENYITNISMKSKLNKSVGGKLIDLLIDKGYATMNGIAFIFQDKVNTSCNYNFTI